VRSALANALACPKCKEHVSADEGFKCRACGLSYTEIDGVPALLRAGHPMLKASQNAHGMGPVRAFLWSKLPEDRLWSDKSRKAIERALSDGRADDPDRLVVNLGAGLERVFRENLAGKRAVARIGLPHAGTVDVFGDVMEFPLVDDSVDLFMSSSVMEHVRDPELGIAEMSRVIKPGGLVYAEIPFIRSFHMAPEDYQRYSISGIKAVFGRHDFEMIEAGVCSGPFTAIALLIADMSMAYLTRRIASLFVPIVYMLVHPIKYLDRLVQDRHAAEFQACNFYYLGRKVAPASRNA
jgi:SAM-dependent methyltransferase